MKSKKIEKNKRDQRKERPPLQTPLLTHLLPAFLLPTLLLSPLLRWPGRELPDVSGCQEVHHRLVAYFLGKQLRHLQMSASARCPACGLSHSLLECRLLVFPSAAVAEEMLQQLYCSPSAPPAYVVLMVPKPFSVRFSWGMSALQSIEPCSPWLHACHCEGSLASGFALQPIAVVLGAPLTLPLCSRRRSPFRDLSGSIRGPSVDTLTCCVPSTFPCHICLAVSLFVSRDA